MKDLFENMEVAFRDFEQACNDFLSKNAICVVCKSYRDGVMLTKISEGYAHQDCIAGQNQEAEESRSRMERMIDKGFNPIEDCV